MARYIIIDAWTGYIFGDTADLDGAARDETPAEACARLDASIGEYGRTYEEVSRLSSDTGYIVYRADIEGGEVLPVVTDGQDQDMIEAVERLCERVCAVETRSAND